jgi:hypothetical protein
MLSAINAMPYTLLAMLMLYTVGNLLAYRRTTIAAARR